MKRERWIYVVLREEKRKEEERSENTCRGLFLFIPSSTTPLLFASSLGLLSFCHHHHRYSLARPLCATFHHGRSSSLALSCMVNLALTLTLTRSLYRRYHYDHHHRLRCRRCRFRSHITFTHSHPSLHKHHRFSPLAPSHFRATIPASPPHTCIHRVFTCCSLLLPSTLAAPSSAK